MKIKDILDIISGTKVILLNTQTRRENFPLAKYKTGTMFTIKNVVEVPGFFPAFILKELRNEYADHGGFCSSRFALYVNPKIYQSGGNV